MVRLAHSVRALDLEDLAATTTTPPLPPRALAQAQTRVEAFSGVATPTRHPRWPEHWVSIWRQQRQRRWSLWSEQARNRWPFRKLKHYYHDRHNRWSFWRRFYYQHDWRIRHRYWWLRRIDYRYEWWSVWPEQASDWRAVRRFRHHKHHFHTFWWFEQYDHVRAVEHRRWTLWSTERPAFLHACFWNK